MGLLFTQAKAHLKWEGANEEFTLILVKKKALPKFSRGIDHILSKKIFRVKPASHFSHIQKNRQNDKKIMLETFES